MLIAVIQWEDWEHRMEPTGFCSVWTKDHYMPYEKCISGLDCKVHGARMGPIWGRQDPGGPHAGPMNLAISEFVRKLWFLRNIVAHQEKLLYLFTGP